MNTETAVAHLEAFIAGGDELGTVSKEDALTALRALEAEQDASRDSRKRLVVLVRAKNELRKTLRNVSNLGKERDALRAENERLKKIETAANKYLQLVDGVQYSGGISGDTGVPAAAKKLRQALAAQDGAGQG